MSVEFYDVKHRTKVTVDDGKVCKTSYSSTT